MVFTIQNTFSLRFGTGNPSLKSVFHRVFWFSLFATGGWGIVEAFQQYTKLDTRWQPDHRPLTENSLLPDSEPIPETLTSSPCASGSLLLHNCSYWQQRPKESFSMQAEALEKRTGWARSRVNPSAIWSYVCRTKIQPSLQWRADGAEA